MFPSQNILDRIRYQQKIYKNQFDLACYLLKQYNLRPAQILRVGWKDFYYPHYVVFPAVKNSRKVVIQDLHVLNSMIQCASVNTTQIFPYVSYYNLHRFFKRHYSHLFKATKKRKNIPSTTVFRYVNARLCDDVETTKEVLHHKSNRSQTYYK